MHRQASLNRLSCISQEQYDSGNQWTSSVCSLHEPKSGCYFGSPVAFDAMTGARAPPHTPVSHNALERCTGHTLQTELLSDILLWTWN